MIFLLLSAAAVALTAFVYAVMLTEPGMIFNPLYNWLEKRIGERWYFKPLIGCARCVAGQMAFWYYFTLGDYRIDFHLLYICFAIFTTQAISKLYNYLRQ